MAAGREAAPEMDTAAHKALTELAPKSEVNEIRRLLSRVPTNLHEVINDAIKLGVERKYRLLMGAAAAFYVREAMRANSAVALLPVGITPGQNCLVNTIYPLQPFTTGATSGPYQFVTNQVFFDLMTAEVDANNGWMFASNSVRFANDPLAGMAYGDTGFINFAEQVVAGRDVLGEYSHHTVIEQLTFFASAILYNSAPKPMVQGVQLRFWDKRCDGEGVNDRYLRIFAGPSFSEVVNDLVHKADGGWSLSDMFADPELPQRLGLGRGRGR
jgi:hypothetical protein